MGDVNVGFSSSSTPAYNPYKFMVYRAAATTSSNAFTTIPFDTAVFDSNANVNLASGVYTVPVTGFYLFSASCGNTAATTTAMGTAIYNGSTQMAVGGFGDPSLATGSGNKYTVTALVSCTAGDTITAKFIGGAGSVIEVGQGACWFCGFLVSRA